MDDAAKLAAFEDLQARLSRTALRFAVCGPKGHSTSWTAFKRGNDYYIGARGLMGAQKISLHASGICRVALTEEFYNSLPTKGLLQPLDRAIAKWRRSETPARGAVHVASIIFPSDYLVHAKPEGTYRKPLIIFGDVPPGKAFEFGFFYSREEIDDLGERLEKVGEPLFSTKLDDGTTVTLVSRLIVFDPSVLPTPEQLRGAHGRIFSKEATKPEYEKTGLTGHFWNQPDDGKSLIMYEIGGLALRRKHMGLAGCPRNSLKIKNSFALLSLKTAVGSRCASTKTISR